MWPRCSNASKKRSDERKQRSDEETHARQGHSLREGHRFVVKVHLVLLGCLAPPRRRVSIAAVDHEATRLLASVPAARERHTTRSHVLKPAQWLTSERPSEGTSARAWGGRAVRAVKCKHSSSENYTRTSRKCCAQRTRSAHPAHTHEQQERSEGDRRLNLSMPSKSFTQNCAQPANLAQFAFFCSHSNIRA